MDSTPQIQPATTDGDLLPIVNERDEPIGVLPRRQVHLGRHLHRAVHICVFDSAGRIILQQRARTKDTFPLFWDWSCTGHVDPGEMYDEAARRELREELGIDAAAAKAEPIFLFKHEANAASGWEFQAFYALRSDGPLDFNRHEIERLIALAPEELAAALAAAATRPEGDWLLAPGFAPGITLGWPYLREALAGGLREKLSGPGRP